MSLFERFLTSMFGPPGSGVEPEPEGGAAAPRTHAPLPAPVPPPAPAPAPAPARERYDGVAQVRVSTDDPEELRKLGFALVDFQRAHPWVHHVSGIDDLLRGVAPERPVLRTLGDVPVRWGEQILVFGRTPLPAGVPGPICARDLLRPALEGLGGSADYLEDPD